MPAVIVVLLRRILTCISIKLDNMSRSEYITSSDSSSVQLGEWALQADPEAVESTLNRPRWEPPVIDFMPFFHNENMKKYMEEGKRYHGISFATSVFDSLSEAAVLVNYLAWILGCGHASVARNDIEKEKVLLRAIQRSKDRSGTGASTFCGSRNRSIQSNWRHAKCAYESN